MTCLDKKRIYDKEYAKSLEFFSTEYERYDKNGRLPLPARHKLEALLKEMFDLFVENNISMFDDHAPGTDIADVLIKFKSEGNPVPRDVMISTSSSCWMSLCLQKTEEEIKTSAERHAQLEVDMALMREKEAIRKKKEAEEEAKKAAEVKARLKAQEEDDWKKRDREIKDWTEKMCQRLDAMRKKKKFFFGATECSDNQIKAIKEYIVQLHRFSDAMNNGLTGFGLYSFNENRMTAHEILLEAFGLEHNEFAESITKNYDFADDFDVVSRTYTHIDEELSIDMLAYACKKAQTAPDIFDQPNMKFTAKDVAKALNVHDLFMALTYHGMPEMCIKNMPNGFMVVPFSTIIKKSYNKDYEPWQYAFVNRDKGMYKMLFESFDDLLETLFNAKEICYGAYPRDAQPNPLYGKSLEQLKIEDELIRQ